MIGKTQNAYLTVFSEAMLDNSHIGGMTSTNPASKEAIVKQHLKMTAPNL